MSSRTSARNRSFVTVVAAACVAAVTLLPSGAGAAIVATVPLATAAQYAVLAGSTVTNTGDSVLNGSVGLDPGTSVTGFPPGIVTPPATTNIDNGAAEQAKADLVLAYDNAAGRSLVGTAGGVTTADLADLTLVGGVYATASKGALSLTGPLTLDGANNPDSVFIFQTDSSLITGSDATFNLIRGAQACNVFWQVGSSATLGSGSDFVGNILALESITVNTGVTVEGRALARTSAVTLDTDVFNPPVCAAQTSTTAVTTAPSTTTTSTTSTTSTTAAPATTTTTAVPATTPTTAPGAAPVGGSGTPTAPITPIAGSPTAPTSGGGTSTATPTGRITTSTATPGSPRGELPRTGSALGLTFLVGLALVTLGSGALRLGRRHS